MIEILVTGIRVYTVENGGVKMADITVTYRFSQPDQAMAVVLPQAYEAGRLVRIPWNREPTATTSGRSGWP